MLKLNSKKSLDPSSRRSDAGSSQGAATLTSEISCPGDTQRCAEHVGENDQFYAKNDRFYVENGLEKCFENQPHSGAVDQKFDWGHSGDLSGAACNVAQPVMMGWWGDEGVA